jgi:hypothetical protein
MSMAPLLVWHLQPVYGLCVATLSACVWPVCGSSTCLYNYGLEPGAVIIDSSRPILRIRLSSSYYNSTKSS